MCRGDVGQWNLVGMGLLESLEGGWEKDGEGENTEGGVGEGQIGERSERKGAGRGRCRWASSLGEPSSRSSRD